MTRPRFSIVSAVYNVEPYLPAFIASIERQRFDLQQVEVIVVDDGSTDRSLATLEAWARRRPKLVKVLTKPNGGQGSARNLGLDRASGEWVTFTDPDDMLDRDFLRTADRFSRANRRIEVMSGNPMLLVEARGRVSNTHPRRHQFDAGNRCVDLDSEPNTFTGSATVSLFRLDRIHQLGLRFDTRIQPNFEDGHFAACFLLGLPSPVVGILRDARYVYRKRATGDSTLQLSQGHPGRFTDVLRFGYLDVLDRARAPDGSIPAWVQHVVIYELSWYLSAYDGPTSEVRIAPELVPSFQELFCEVIGRLDPDVVATHTARPLRSIWADILAHGCRPGAWHSPSVARTKVDTQMGLVRLNYRYDGPPPREEFLAGGDPVQPAFGKVMDHMYYGRTLMFERVVWLPAEPVPLVRLNGRLLPIVAGTPEPGKDLATGIGRDLAWLVRNMARADVTAAARRRSRMIFARLTNPIVRVAARTGPIRSRYGDAWVLMDRLDNADDNAERLFEYLRAKRRDINAWFVISKGTADWERIQAAGGRHVVAHGGLAWKLLMFNCRWLMSSHADLSIMSPPELIGGGARSTWKFAFLQHGVIKDDLSRWLNPKDMDLFVVSTRPELDSIVADGTGYLVTTKETRDTGLPRFDRLLAKGRLVEADSRDLVIVAPTWRMWLSVASPDAPSRTTIAGDVLRSEYVDQWHAFLSSPMLAEAVSRRGWRVGFMPHPNMQPLLAKMDLPAHVEALGFEDNDAQELYARCALLVTDYSSVAFNVAYLDAPVVYFQFDLETVMDGMHLGRQGYFDYREAGFGPVTTTVEAAIDAAVASIDNGPRPTVAYQARIDATFPERDGRACARVVAAVEELSQPYSSIR